MGGLGRRYVTVGLAALVTVAPLVAPPTDATAASDQARRVATETAVATEVELAAAALQPLGWVAVGGPYGSDPTTLPKGNAVFAVGQAGDPYYHERAGTNWTGNRSLGGQLDSVVAPAEALVGPQDPNFTVFGIGIDSGVYYRTRNAWWQAAGGGFISSPTSVIFGGETYVFGVGFDEAIWFRRLNSGWATLGGRIVSDLGVTTDGTSLYVSGLGADNAFWYQRLTAGKWSGWLSLGGGLASYPAATNEGNKGYLFAIGGDGAVWYQGVQNGAWSGWIGLGGGAESAPAVVAHNGLIDVYIVGLDLAMYSNHWNGSGWSGWIGRGGGFSSNPAANTTGVFALGFDDRLWYGPVR